MCFYSCFKKSRGVICIYPKFKEEKVILSILILKLHYVEENLMDIVIKIM